MELIFKRKSLSIQYTESSEADDKGSKPISRIFYGQNIKTRLRHISKI